jgi:hypothetical protein
MRCVSWLVAPVSVETTLVIAKLLIGLTAARLASLDSNPARSGEKNSNAR